MSGSPQWPLQRAIFVRLSGDATLVTTLGASVYDHVPDGAAFPYVAIGPMTENPRDTMGKTGRDVTVTIDGWSQYVGMKQVKDLMNRVDELLDRWQPTVTGWNAVQLINDSGPEAFRDPDGITRHGVARYRIHLQQ